MNINSKSVATTTVGYMCLALAGWMLSMPNAAWFPKLYGFGEAMIYPLAIVLAVMGILSFLQSRALDTIVFFGGAGLFWSDYTYYASSSFSNAMEPSAYTGWYAFVWAVFFCYVWLGSFKSGVLRMLFLLGLWLTLLALAIGSWASSGVFIVLGGYLGLITSILAAITSAKDVIGHGLKGGDPNVEAAKA